MITVRKGLAVKHKMKDNSDKYYSSKRQKRLNRREKVGEYAEHGCTRCHDAEKGHKAGIYIVVEKEVQCDEHRLGEYTPHRCRKAI